MIDVPWGILESLKDSEGLQGSSEGSPKAKGGYLGAQRHFIAAPVGHLGPQIGHLES